MPTRGKSSVGESTPRATRSSNRASSGRFATKDTIKTEGLSVIEDDPTSPTTAAQHSQSTSEHVPMSPSERGKKGISHGMSPHDRGVLGAQARWAKVHAGPEAQKEATDKGRGA